MLKQLGFLVTLFLSNLLIVCGQDWQTVRSGRVAYFSSVVGYVKCIRVDSVKFDKDSVLYLMPNIQQLSYNCFTPRGSSWIGKKVVIQANGVNLFFNNNNDTIRMVTWAKVGESWTFFENKDSIKIIAEVKSAEIQTVLGELDSVKTIGFKIYDKKGLAYDYSLNEKTLRLSKNNGFVNAINFNVFPKDLDFVYFEQLEFFTLIGLNNPDRGVQNLTWLGVHDFQVGDELHFLIKRWDWSSNLGYYYTWKTSWKFLERKDSKDSVFYRIEKKESLEKRVEKWDNISYTFTHDTITTMHKPDSLFDKLPGEPIVSDYGADANVMIRDGDFVKKFTSYQPIRKSSDDSCWHFLIFDGDGPGYYLKGLGGPYYEYNEINRGDEKTLVYYKKGTLTWGTPLVITDVKSLDKEEQVKIYPNPANDFVTIENLSGKAENYLLQLIDMQGREVLKNSITLSNSYRLDLSSLTEGAYLLKLKNREKQISRMIVKK